MALPRGLPWPFDFSNLTGGFATDVSHSFPYRAANLYERGAANPADLSGIPSVPDGAKGWLQHRSYRATCARCSRLTLSRRTLSRIGINQPTAPMLVAILSVNGELLITITLQNLESPY